MPRSRRFGRGDALAVLSLIGTAVIIALPILRGGYLTYIDNSVHLAEVYDLARHSGNGWSEIGFAGFPLATLHSPLFYPLLAQAVRLGAPLEPIYAGLLLAGFVATPLALYFVSRRRLDAGPSALLAYLALVQPPMIWGIGSPLGGMWTYGLASALMVIVTDLLARPLLTNRQHLAASALLALATLTHLFVLPVIAFVAVITTVVHTRARSLTRLELFCRSAGWLIAALASADYWLTFIWVGNTNPPPLKPLAPLDVLARLFLPSDPMDLLNDQIGEALRWDLHMTDALPMIALVALGVVGFLKRKTTNDPLVTTGFVLALALLGSLFVHHYFPLAFLGPVSWRFIDWVRIGFAFSAMPALASIRIRSLLPVKTPVFIGAAVLGPLLGIWWGLPLRLDSPASVTDELKRIEPLWAWLKENAREDWGRIYLEDTLGSDWKAAGLSQTHLLALTAHSVGMPQLGTYYGVVPYELRWTLSEFDTLFSTPAPTKEWILEAMDKTNAGVLVTSNGEVSDFIARTGVFDELHSVSRYSVWRRRDAADRPIAELSPTNHVSAVRSGPGKLDFDLRTEYSRARVLAKTGWHPWWHLDGIPGAWLRESPEGFIVIDDIPEGQFHVRLWYEPDPLPFRISMVGFAILAAWSVALIRPAGFRKRKTDGHPA